MNEKKITSQLVDELIDSVSDLEAVKAPPFFKDKVLNSLGRKEEIEEVSPFFHWFTPKIQLAALVAFVLLNLGVLYYYGSYNQEQELQTFATSYGLTSSQEDTILN